MKKTVLTLTTILISCASLQTIQGQDFSDLPVLTEEAPMAEEDLNESDLSLISADDSEAIVPETESPDPVLSKTEIPVTVISEAEVPVTVISAAEIPEAEEELTSGLEDVLTYQAGESENQEDKKDQASLEREFAMKAFGDDSAEITARSEDGSVLVCGDSGILFMNYTNIGEAMQIPSSAICWDGASNRWLEVDQNGNRSVLASGIYQFYGSSFWRIGSGGRAVGGYMIDGDSWSYYLGKADIVSGFASKAGSDGFLPDAVYHGARWLDSDYLTVKGGYHSCNSGKYYFKKDGTILKNGVMKVRDRYYEFGEDGVCVRSYMTNYWKQERLGYYVRVDGDGNIIREQGFYEFDGNRYFLCGNSGRRIQGWFRYKNGTYYFDKETGAQAMGYQVIEGVPYYFDPSSQDPGKMARGNVFIDGKRHCFAYKNGNLITGWITGGANGDHRYYVNNDGSLKRGWGRVASENRTYYFEPTWGYVLRGFQTIDGKRYLFVEETDAVGRGWVIYKGDQYYCDPKTAVLTTGFAEINGRSYYFDETGKLVTNKTRYSLNGTLYDIDQWGHISESALSEAEQLAKERLDIIGWDLRSAYLWSCMDYEYIDDTVPYGYQPADYYGIYGLEHHYGDCYVMASTFYQMGKLLGYDIHFVMGYVKSIQYGMSPHGWCEIDEPDGTFVYDPDFEASKGRNGYRIYYGMPTTWMYTEYERMN